ncbi:hypothetical protein N2152v2_000028 [Parachlorella kessleri]
MATGLTEPPSPEVEIQFVYTPLAPEQLRWYYHKAPYTIKGLHFESIPPPTALDQANCLLPVAVMGHLFPAFCTAPRLGDMMSAGAKAKADLLGPLGGSCQHFHWSWSRAEEYERCWWQEEAELVGPRGGGGTAAGRGGGGGSPTKQHGSALMLAAQQAPDAPLSWQVTKGDDADCCAAKAGSRRRTGWRVPGVS